MFKLRKFIDQSKLFIDEIDLTKFLMVRSHCLVAKADGS
jgi:hypothetical protein